MRRWSAWGCLREDRTHRWDGVFQQRNESNRLENRNAQRRSNRTGSLMAQMTIRASRVAGGVVMVPVADHTSGEHQQRDQRQANSEDANRLPHG